MDRTLWIYDLRTNLHFTLKQNPLRYEHLEDFIAAYRPEDRGSRSERSGSSRSPTTNCCSATKSAST